MATNVCNGSAPPDGCVPTYHGTSAICYHNQDECDHPDTYCTGTSASCPQTTLKLLGGIRMGSIAFQQLPDGSSLPTGPVHAFNHSLVNGVYMTGNSSVQVELHGYSVLCGNLTYSIQLLHMKSTFQSEDAVALMDGTITRRILSESNVTLRVVLDARLLHKEIYTVSVTVYDTRNNSATSRSPPLLVDNTAPVFGGVIHDGVGGNPRLDDSYQSSLNTVTVHWAVAGIRDLESGVDLNSYKMSIGTSIGTGNILSSRPCAAVDVIAGRCTATGLTMVSGTKYYCTLEVANRVGLVSRFTSDGITPDDSAADPGLISLSMPRDLSDVQYVLNSRTLSFSFTLLNTSDPQSHVASLRWRICDTTKSREVCSRQDYSEFHCPSIPCTVHIVQAEDSPLVADGAFLDNHRYDVRVKAMNGASLESTTTQEFLVDLSAPNTGYVSHVLTSAEKTLPDMFSTLKCTWSGFYDVGLGIHHYEVSIVSISAYNRTVPVLAMPRTTVSNDTTALESSLHLSPEMLYTSCVTAVDKAWNTMTRCSNEITIDP